MLKKKNRESLIKTTRIYMPKPQDLFHVTNIYTWLPNFIKYKIISIQKMNELLIICYLIIVKLKML